MSSILPSNSKLDVDLKRDVRPVLERGLALDVNPGGGVGDIDTGVDERLRIFSRVS